MMRKMSKIKDKFKNYCFFDPFPNTDYFAYVPHKSNEERLLEAVISVNESSKLALEALHEHLVCELAEDVLSKDLEVYYRAFLDNRYDLKQSSSGWDDHCIARYSGRLQENLDENPNWYKIRGDQHDREEAERRLIRAIASR